MRYEAQTYETQATKAQHARATAERIVKYVSADDNEWSRWLARYALEVVDREEAKVAVLTCSDARVEGVS